MSATWDRVADLPVRIDGYALEGHSRTTGQFERVTTVFRLGGAGEEGAGEDVTWSADDQRAQLERGPALPLDGDWTLASLSEHVDALDLFDGRPPAFPEYRDYRRWAIESAALDLGLRQAGTSLHDALGREPEPVRFVASLRLGDPPTAVPVLERLAAYPGARFKLDPEPSWTQSLIAELAATGSVDVMDLKGLYRNTPVDVETDPVLYRRITEAFPMAWLEDPDLSVPEADAALQPHRDRVTWDANIHSVEDVERLPFPPRTLNCKPSRYGSVRRLFDFYDFCVLQGIGLYGGGQSELSVGRGQIQLLASIFHPGASNDVAPAGWDHADWPRTGLPVSPLAPDPEPIGFRRRGGLPSAG